jgi:hypothetical protein
MVPPFRFVVGARAHDRRHWLDGRRVSRQAAGVEILDDLAGDEPDEWARAWVHGVGFP